MKKCSKCNEIKNLEEFYDTKGGVLGKRGSCIECDSHYSKEYNLSKRKNKTINDPEYKKLYYQKNKGKIREYRKQRYKNNECFRLSQIVRCRISAELKKKHKMQTSRSIKLLGCTFQYLKEYLQSKFTEGMSWENYGEWHVDHIRPCSSFDLTNQSQQSECFHYTNLQPLWAYDNLSKGSKYSSPTMT